MTGFYMKRNNGLKWVNPFHSYMALHIEASHLISTATQITGFYIKK